MNKHNHSSKKQAIVGALVPFTFGVLELIMAVRDANFGLAIGGITLLGIAFLIFVVIYRICKECEKEEENGT